HCRFRYVRYSGAAASSDARPRPDQSVASVSKKVSLERKAVFSIHRIDDVGHPDTKPVYGNKRRQHLGGGRRGATPQHHRKIRWRCTASRTTAAGWTAGTERVGEIDRI